MIPEERWLEALNLPLRPTLGAALAAGALLLLDRLGELDLDAIHPAADPIVVVVCTVFSILSLLALVDLLLVPLRERQRQSRLAVRRAVRLKEQEQQRDERRARALASLDHLSREEISYAASCLRNGSPSFYTYVFSPPVAMLRGKGLVWTPRGAHHQDHYPFSFHDFVWQVLLERRDEFLARDRAAAEATSRRRA